MRVETTFRQSLIQLQQDLRRFEKVVEYFPAEKLEDILKTELVVTDLPKSGIYDHRWLQRKFFISPGLLESFRSFWDEQGSEDSSRERMCKLFFLHEFFHLGQQIDSNTYAYSRNTKDSISDFDYVADAAAVKILYLLENSVGLWNDHLASVLRDHLLCGEAFSYADDKREGKKISGERLKRQVIWHLQYARAVSFKPERTFDDFVIEAPLNVEILKLEHVDRRINLTNEKEVEPDDLKMIEIHISWRGSRIIHPMTMPSYSEKLTQGLFEYNFDGTVEAFRALFDQNLSLVGRELGPKTGTRTVSGPPRPIEGIEHGFDWKRVETLVVGLLPDGPNENEFWSRSGGDKSALRTNQTGRAQWHTAISLIKNGGGGITATDLLKRLHEEYPSNDEVRSLFNACLANN